MFLNLIDLLNYYVVKKISYFLYVAPWNFLKIGPMGSSHWFLDQNHFYNFLNSFCTQGNHTQLLQRTYKNTKNATFFCKEHKRMQRMQRSSAKNVKERKNISSFCKRMQNVLFFFQYIYIQIYIQIYIEKLTLRSFLTL